MDEQHSFPKHKIKILLLEKIHPIAVDALKKAGYAVETSNKDLSSQELLERIPEIHVLGIRSKTDIAAAHIAQAKRLLAIGCFCVGTNHVALSEAELAGIPVFNAPYGNTRSVAELTLGNILSLARRAAEKNIKLHQGIWDKSADGLFEVRDKTLGIIGYGHIGQQVGILAEAIGLRVIFYDKLKKLPLGNVKSLTTMKEVLERADFVTLHIPPLPGGRVLIGKEELSWMKPGSYLINSARGSLVDLSALKNALQERRLAGAAVDVFPEEPNSNDEPFNCELSGMHNAILTPHIGGSTQEAQENIGREVADAFIKFIDAGVTSGAVNFPEVDMPFNPESHRILNAHRNIPGVLRDVNTIISKCGANINAQHLATRSEIGYLVMDINKEVSQEVYAEICRLPSSIKTRILY